MKEAYVAKIPEAMYSSNRGESMNGSVSTAELNVPRSKETSKNKNLFAERLSKKDSQNKEAKSALQKFISQKREQEGKKRPEKKHSKKWVEEIQKQAEAFLGKKYGELASANEKVLEVIEEAVKEIKDLKSADTFMLVYHYLKIRDSVLENKVAETFLSKIEAELESEEREINVDRLQALVERDLAGAEDKIPFEEEEIANARLSNLKKNQQGQEVSSSKNPLPHVDKAYTFARDEDLPQEVKFDNENELFTKDEAGNYTFTQEFPDDLKNVIRSIDSLALIKGKLDDDVASLITKIQESSATEQQKLLVTNKLTQYIEGFKKEEGKKLKKSWYGNYELNDHEKDVIDEDIKTIVRVAMEQGRDADAILGEEVRGNEIDRLFNRMFRSVDGNIRQNFDQAFGTPGTYELQDFFNYLSTLKDQALSQANRGGEGAEFYRQKAALITKLVNMYYMEFNLRYLMHNAYQIAETGGDFEQFVNFCKSFSSEYADLIFLAAPEVEMAMRVQEEVLYEIKAKNNGNIPPEMVMYNPHGLESDFVKLTRQKMEQLNDQGLFAVRGGKAKLEQWQIERALALARGYGMVSARLPEIIAECPIVAPPADPRSQVSIAWESISWELNPWDNKFKRFQIGLGETYRSRGHISRGKAVLLYFSEHKPKHWWERFNKKQMQDLLALDEITNVARLNPKKYGRRIIDMRNLLKAGSPMTHTSWRVFVSALNRNHELRPTLERNPGLQLSAMWNKNLYEANSKARYEFMKRYDQEHPDAYSTEKLKAWHEEERRLGLRSEGQNEYKQKNRIALHGAAKRIPHVLLRIMLDKENGILSRQERKDLLVRLFGEGSEKELMERFTKAYSDLTAAKENLMRRRREKFVEARKRNFSDENELFFTDEEDRLLDDDMAVIGRKVRQDQQGPIFEIPEGAEARDRDSRIEKAIQVRDEMIRLMADDALLNRVQDKLAKSEMAFSMTWEDVPFGEFHYARSGGRGLITRKWTDNQAVSKGVNETINLSKNLSVFQGPEQIVGQIRKIYDEIKIDDDGKARDFCILLAKGLIRFYEKEPMSKIPVFGEAKELWSSLVSHEGNSYAQKVYGHSAMAWDSDDIHNFWDRLGPAIELDPHHVQDLMKETGGGFWQAMGARSKVAIYFLLAVIGYEMYQRLINATGVLETGGGDGKH